MEKSSKAGQPISAPTSTTVNWNERLRKITLICQQAARGDLESRIVGVEATDEFGQMCQAINDILDRSDSYVREAAAAMEYCSRDEFHRPILLRGMAGAYQKSASGINAAILKMRENHEQLAFTARLANETANNVNLVAAACEEMTISSNDISNQATNASQLSEKAVQEAGQAGAAAVSLHESAKKIDGIVSMIKGIASQTNLLALNATIEAARAGEAGRGFAVVAAEVKELSRRCTKATGDIAAQVDSMRETVASVSKCIGNISQSITKIHDGSQTVARSVEEQVLATTEIAKNIAAVSEKTAQISERIAA